MRSFICTRKFSNIIKSRITPAVIDEKLRSVSFPDFVFNSFLRPPELRGNVTTKTIFSDCTTGKGLTNEEAFMNSLVFAHVLKEKYGIKSGDGVAIVSPNHIEYLTAFHGVGFSGAFSSPVSPYYTSEEMKYQFEATNPKLIICHSSCFERAKKALGSSSVPIIILGSEVVESFPTISDLNSLYSAKDIDPLAFKVDQNSLLAVPFSSGTTGKPKGVMLTHRNAVFNTISALPSDPAEYADAIALLPLPFFHIFGLSVISFLVHMNVPVSFLPVFEFESFLKHIEEQRATHTFIVPPIALALLKHPFVAKYNLSSLRYIACGAAPLSPEVHKGILEKFPLQMINGWGMTECFSTGSRVPLGTPPRIGSVGLLQPGSEAKIVHAITGQDLPPTEVGEILLRGEHVMKGYLNNPEATKETIREDGFMHTGDIGRFDEDGWLYIVDRAKELIKYKGLPVAPSELEAVLLSMPAVKDAVVIPVEDEEAGQVPRGYVVLQPGAPVSAADVVQFVHEKVAPHKRLRGGVFFVDAIPKNPAGKLLRREMIRIDREREAQLSKP